MKAPAGVARVSLPTRAVEEVFDRTRGDILLAGVIALALSALAALELIFKLSSHIRFG